MKLSNVMIIVRETGWPGNWGKGKTIAEAKKNARNPRTNYKVYLCHPDTFVCGMGGFVFPHGFDPVEIQSVQTRRKKARSIFKVR